MQADLRSRFISNQNQNCSSAALRAIFFTAAWGFVMSESRREALKLSVLGALGLTGCGQNGQRAQRGMRLLAVQPVNEEQLPDILIQTKDANVGGSWVLLQYNNVNHNYDVSRNKEPLPTTFGAR
jgi:hypothetical protein